MIIILTSPQKEDWVPVLDSLLRRVHSAKIDGNTIYFGNKKVGTYHLSDQEFQVEGDWERGVKCAASVIAGTTLVGFSGSITVDGRLVELQDLQTAVGDLIAEENFNLANISSKN